MSTDPGADAATATQPVRDIRVGGCVDATLEKRSDGSSVLRSTEALQPYPRRMTDRLEHWAQATPEHTLAARRAPGGGDWVRVSYAQMLQRVQAVAQALTDRGLSAGRPVAILSDNDLEHLTLALGCAWAGVPYTPVSPAYSLVSSDFAKLRHVLATTTPGLVFASGPAYAAAIAAAVGADVEVVLGDGTLDGRAATPFPALLGMRAGPAGAAAHDAVGPDTIVEFLFTSGSTKVPKAVVNTHRMLCADVQMQTQALAFVQDVPPVLVDWLPWNHTFGGNQNIGLVLHNGGTLYIDEGKPTAKGIAATLRNCARSRRRSTSTCRRASRRSSTRWTETPACATACSPPAGLHVCGRRAVAIGMGPARPPCRNRHRSARAHAHRPGNDETAPSCTFALGKRDRPALPRRRRQAGAHRRPSGEDRDPLPRART